MRQTSKKNFISLSKAPETAYCPYLQTTLWLAEHQLEHFRNPLGVLPLNGFLERVSKIPNLDLNLLPRLSGLSETTTPKEEITIVDAEEMFPCFSLNNPFFANAIALEAWDIVEYLVRWKGWLECGHSCGRIQTPLEVFILQVLPGTSSMTLQVLESQTPKVFAWIEAMLTEAPLSVNTVAFESTFSPLGSLLHSLVFQPSKAGRLQEYDKKGCVSVHLARLLIKFGGKISPVPECWSQEKKAQQRLEKFIFEYFLRFRKFQLPVDIVLLIGSFAKDSFWELIPENAFVREIAKQKANHYKEFLDFVIYGHRTKKKPSSNRNKRKNSAVAIKHRQKQQQYLLPVGSKRKKLSIMAKLKRQKLKPETSRKRQITLPNSSSQTAESQV